MTPRPAPAPAPARVRNGAPRLHLSPLVLAILAAFPGAGSAATARAVVRPATPAPKTVPVPAASGWLVSTSTASLPTPMPTPVANSAGGSNLTINQASTSAVYNWQSFDIGSASSVTFIYPSAAGSSLNRVTGSASPSAIFGSLSSQYANPTPGGAPLIGGSIYLINANGILFGKGATVDTGALVASTLDLQDADFYSGLSQSITSRGYTFGQLAPAVPNNFVLVDAGAQITTTSGGRVFLFANDDVANAGTITTPNGQTVLAAGDQIYLNLPTNEPMYASEVNPQIPAVNGLLVEVGTGMGTVTNVQGGVINTPTGNTTLVGMAVNQNGRINATTSVSQDGSVFLLARGSATSPVQGSVIVKEATVSGSLTLGPGSVVDIEPDTTLNASGAQATSSASSTFTPSLVELAGKTIEMQANSAIIAHGGTVDARAETTPWYEPSGANQATFDATAQTGDDARLVLDAGATIDVSGTTTTTVSAARNFVTTALLGANDLANAPLQRTGPVYRSELTFDIRAAVPILGDTSAYLDAIQKTATEQLSAGGSIKLLSTGAVVTNPSATLNVSGGVVNYTSAVVDPSELLGSNGEVYTFNQAPANQTYVAVLGAPTGELTRWGVLPSYAPSQLSAGIVTPGYVAGQAGGSLSVVTPLAVLDGQINAKVTQGARQTAGLDALATASQLLLGARTDGGDTSVLPVGVEALDIVPAPGSLGASFWSDPTDPMATLPSTSRIAASTLNASGLGQFTVTAGGDVQLQPGANLALPARGVLDLLSLNGSIGLAANVSAAGGSVAATTLAPGGLASDTGITLDAGTRLDVSGAWVNRAMDGATAAAATAGGSVKLSSGSSLDLQDASTIDVSGGATVGVNGAVAGTAAGSVALESNTNEGGVASPVHIGSQLVANSLGGGGTLTLSADAISIGAGALPGGVADGPAVGSLVLSNQFFNQGAFTNYQIEATSALLVQPYATVQPQASNWILTPTAATMPTGSQPSSFLAVGQLPVSQRLPASVSLTATAPLGAASGELDVAAGASIVTDPLGSVTLTAGLNLNVSGKIVAPAGEVTLQTVSPSQIEPVTGVLTLGPQADLDVAGVTLLQPQTGVLPTGQVLAGGHVVLSSANTGAATTPLVMEPGAVIDADGTSAVIGVTTTNALGSTSVASQPVASAGGSVSIAAGGAGAALAGTMHALGGDASVSGGSFELGVGGGATIVLQQAPVTASTALAGIVGVSAQSLSQGFSDASLQTAGQVHFSSDLTLAMAGHLTIDAPVLSAAPNVSSVVLSGASTLSVGASYQQSPSGAGATGGASSLSLDGGLVELFGQQVAQGFGKVQVNATSELRLESVTGSGSAQGDLAVQGALTLNAPQVVPTTASQFTFDAPGQQVLVTGGDSTAAVPLSAGGGITINAADITTVDPANASQYGVLRAPFGSIVLNASDSITIGSGSLLSVSGAGMTVPFGETSGGANWTYSGAAVSAPPQKTISLNAPGGAIDVASGSTLDLSGGGNLLAREFVPGNGGTNDIFAGAAAGSFAVVPASSAYAAQDADILQLKDASGKLASVTLGQDITFGAGGPIPAGTYAVLPAEYATLAGAFLVTPTASSAPLALGAAVKQTDGSVLMGGQFVEAGTGFGSSLTQSFKVLSSTQALAYSEIDQANANTYFSAQAAAAGVGAPPLPTDAGLLGISAAQLQLAGTTSFKLPTVTTTTNSVTTTTTVGRGGELDISADAIQVGGTPTSGVLSVSAADLNATGAALVVLGGRTDASSGLLDVSANSVVVSAGTPLTLNDLVLVANNAVTLQAGATIAAPVTASGATAVVAPTLSLQGDGALLRVSTDPDAASTRTGVQGQAGSLSIGSGVALSGGAITAEGTLANVIATDATLNAQAITLSAGHVAVGDAAGATAGAGTLVLTPALAAQVGGAQSLTLRSATGLDLVGAVSLGGSALASLTLDTPGIDLLGPDAASTITAGGVTLTNTSGNTAAATAGGNSLQIQALGGTGSGQVLIGPGSVAIGGVGQTAINAAHEVVLNNGANLSTSGDLLVSAAALQAGAGAGASLQSGGTFTLASSGTLSGTAAGAGAQVSIAAQAIDQQGRLVLPSGQLTLSATGAATADGSATIHFASGSVTDVSGRTPSFDGIAVSTPGGTLEVLAPAGNVREDAGATLDVSATGAAAGSIAISAPAATVALLGSLQGSAAAGQAGGSLSIDSNTALDLAALAATIDAQPNNFTGSLTLRNRSGDQQVAAGTSLSAQNISISADAGTLAIDGSLTATGASGASVTLAGGTALNINAGATVGAHSTGSTGSQVQLLSGALQLQSDGSFTGSPGMVSFNGGVIDTSAASGGVNGSLLVRAQRGANGTDVAIAGSGGTVVQGATQIEVESVKQYAASTVGTALMSQVANDNATLGATAAQVTGRVGALLDTAAPLQLRSGVEIDSTGDLTMVGNASAGGWNLTQFAANGSAQAQPSGAPMDLTLRAAGNLDIVGSLSDGFTPSGASAPATASAASKITPSAVIAQVGGSYLQGANITLVGGADLGAANVLSTIASTTQGDVTIGAAGANVLVRSTTGDIRIAAGRDVTLLNAQADVYTTGTPVPMATLLDAGYVGNLLPTSAYLYAGAASQSPFLSGGGSLSVAAGRDIVGADPNAATLQYATAWAWRALDEKTGGQPMWWSRYDQFQQGFATFGGGNLSASAQRDIVNGEFSAAGSGYVPRVDGSAAAAVTYVGGDLSVSAGRDVLGGFVLADGATGSVAAGRDIAIGSAPFALQVLYGNTALDIGALDNTELGIVSAIELVPATKEYSNVPLNWYIQWLTPQATLDVQAAAGDLQYDAVSPQAGNLTYYNSNGLANLFVPDVVSFTAPNGSIGAGKLIQDPACKTRLSLLADVDLSVTGITVEATNPVPAVPTQLLDMNTSDLLATPTYAASLDLGNRAPMELVAQTGDITLTQGILTTTSLRMIAGRDIDMLYSGGEFRGITLQSQAADELSLFQAGRDIDFAADGGQGVGGVDFYGPGNLLILAGRNIDLSTSGGVRADGNRENTALPAASGNVTVEAGVSLQSGDYTQAAAWYFPVLGGTGIAGFAPDLVAQLSALQAQQALPAPGSSAAARYAALPVATQITQVQALVGAAVFNAAVLADAQRRNPGTTLAQAMQAFTSLDAADQQSVLGAALANAWVAALTPTQQQQQVLAFAASAKSSFVDPLSAVSLQQFVASQGAAAGLDVADALAAFEQMTRERQALFTNEVLVSVLRTAGRTASALSGSAQTAAYAPAYAALDTVFPGAGTTGSLSMGASQIETLQNSNIDVLAPRGSVDVGTVVASGTPKGADFLGLVTADGGNLSVVVGDSVNVDQSRVFTVGLGDLLMWASTGSLDAGRGGKTVIGAPTPVYYLNSTGQFVADVSGAFSGSGIAVLDPASSLDLYAPKGTIDAGDAGIKALGNAYFGAQSFANTDALSVGGVSVGAPPPASTGGATAGLAAVASSAIAATTINAGDSEEEKERKRRKRLNLVLDFLGFGDVPAKP